MDNLQEIDGMQGIYKIEPQKIMYEFSYNSNFMYCQDYKTKKTIKSIKFKEE